MMRSLTVKWIVTLLLTSMVGVILVGLFAYRATVTEYDRLRVERAQIAFVDMASAYYQSRQEWDGLEAWMRTSQVPPGSPLIVPPPQQFALADASGTVVIGHGLFQTGERLTPQLLEQGIPITVGDKRVGTALLALPAPELDPRERRYIEGTNQALFIGAIGAGATAVLIGILLSRRFLRPLSELTRAITAMKAGDLNQQVEVRTDDELGALARTFNQMSAEIHRANQLRKQMTADIAHDLRTPLMVISGYLEALRDGTLPPTQDRLDAMNQEATLLKRLVEDLRTLSLADAGELKLVYQSVQPRELLEQSRQAFEPLAAESQVTLKVEADEALPALQADRERMAQVLANVVSNALRYTPPGGTITLQARAGQDAVQLIVRDTGTGIPADILPNIFERFYRATESRQQAQGESGLGLAIARSIVEAHSGTITAQSQSGAGTSITITLPGGFPSKSTS